MKYILYPLIYVNFNNLFNLFFIVLTYVVIVMTLLIPVIIFIWNFKFSLLEYKEVNIALKEELKDVTWRTTKESIEEIWINN